MSNRVVGDVAVRVGADVKGLGIGLRDAGRQVDRFGTGATARAAKVVRGLRNVALAATAMGAGLAAAGRQAISALDGIGKTASKLGITAEELQRLRFAAESAGVASNTLDMAVQRFTRRAAEAAQGTGEAKAALEEMGIELKNADGSMRTTQELLGSVAEALQNTTSQADRVRLSFKLFDSEGVAMVNMLQNGKQAFEDATAAADAFGAVVGNEVVKEAEALQDEMGRLGAGIRGQLNSALVEAGPLLVILAENALKLARAFNTLVGFIGDVWAATDELIDPKRRLIKSQNDLVVAMGEEIEQSITLQKVLGEAGRMSVATAKVKLQEAQARMKNAAAAVAEAKAIQEGILVGINQQLSGNRDLRNSLVPPGADEGNVPLRMREQVEGLDAAIAGLMTRQQEALGPLSQMEEQYQRTTENVEKLTTAISDATDGFVNLGGTNHEVIKPTETEDDKGGGGSRSTSKSDSMMDELLGLTDDAQQRTSERMQSALEKQAEFQQQAMEQLTAARDQGLITQEQYQQAEQILAEDHNARMRQINQQRIGDALSASSELFSALASASSSGNQRLMRISQGFAAAQALISTYQGAAKELEKGTLGFATAAAVIAKGIGFVAAIKGTSASGGTAVGPRPGAGGTGGTQIAEQPQQLTREINVNLRDNGTGQARGIRGIFDELNDALDDGANLNVNII